MPPLSLWVALSIPPPWKQKQISKDGLGARCNGAVIMMIAPHVVGFGPGQRPKMGMEKWGYKEKRCGRIGLHTNWLMKRCPLLCAFVTTVTTRRVLILVINGSARMRKNMADRRAKGRHARGNRHGKASLHERQINDIRAAYAGGMTQRELADLFGVGCTSIQKIVRGERWKHVPWAGL
jgi:hypothetical protein